MTTRHTDFTHAGETERIEARLGSLMAAALHERAATMPHDVAERLRAARERALAQGRRARAMAATPTAVLAGSRTVALGAPSPWWRRLAGVLPLVLLVGGLLLIRQWQMQEQAWAVAEVDALLLSDDVPPAAYADPGFVEFLRWPPP
jgi:hypothetical protein